MLAIYLPFDDYDDFGHNDCYICNFSRLNDYQKSACALLACLTGYWLGLIKLRATFPPKLQKPLIAWNFESPQILSNGDTLNHTVTLKLT